MVNMTPKTAKEYVDEAIIEVDEFIAGLEFDMEYPGEQLRILTPNLEKLREPRASLADGSDEFKNQDLPFMAVTNKLDTQLPFSHMLALINDMHRNGLNIETDS